ncbi:hypothetical protein EVAR_33708_1 [Eumeta japonica]|uniref:Uncharacterized protein n=1 Tax=Eumeta variegata TaxID=151549 RepID=A0A4C1VTS4_EUMVA|nr:hypothetical protein EVAR_33708_1 [Eumeta japonica]
MILTCAKFIEFERYQSHIVQYVYDVANAKPALTSLPPHKWPVALTSMQSTASTLTIHPEMLTLYEVKVSSGGPLLPSLAHSLSFTTLPLPSGRQRTDDFYWVAKSTLIARSHHYLPPPRIKRLTIGFTANRRAGYDRHSRRAEIFVSESKLVSRISISL